MATTRAPRKTSTATPLQKTAKKAAKTAAKTPAKGASPLRGPIRVGIGGWSFDPWRETFYPAEVSKKNELNYASRHVTSIEINSTYYGSQKPVTFAKWREDTPEGFVFSVKASRYCTTRRVLAEAGDSIDKFIHSGIAELGPKLGPIVWQFAPTKVFDADDFGAFLELLPQAVDGVALRHVMDVRHPSFMSEDYLALARSHHAATVFTDADKFPSFADATGPFVYARLMESKADQATGYTASELDVWARHAKRFATGHDPKGLPRVAKASPAAGPRDVFIYFINGAKERAPAAAAALLERLGWKPAAA